MGKIEKVASFAVSVALGVFVAGYVMNALKGNSVVDQARAGFNG